MEAAQRIKDIWAKNPDLPKDVKMAMAQSVQNQMEMEKKLKQTEAAAAKFYQQSASEKAAAIKRELASSGLPEKAQQKIADMARNDPQGARDLLKSLTGGGNQQANSSTAAAMEEEETDEAEEMMQSIMGSFAGKRRYTEFERDPKNKKGRKNQNQNNNHADNQPADDGSLSHREWVNKSGDRQTATMLSALPSHDQRSAYQYYSDPEIQQERQSVPKLNWIDRSADSKSHSSSSSTPNGQAGQPHGQAPGGFQQINPYELKRMALTWRPSSMSGASFLESKTKGDGRNVHRARDDLPPIYEKYWKATFDAFEDKTNLITFRCGELTSKRNDKNDWSCTLNNPMMV